MELAWHLLKGLFLMTVVLGPIALVTIAVDTRLKKTPEGVYAAAVIRFAVSVILVVGLAVLLIWLWRHRQLTTGDWWQTGFVALFLQSLVQDWRRLRALIEERRQARAFAQSEDNKPSEFHYASETPK